MATENRLQTMFITIIFIVSLHTLCLSQGTSSYKPTKLTFNVTEGFSDMFVGNVKQSSYFQNKFSKAVLDSLKLSLQAASGNQVVTLFKIAADTGVIRTAKTIDRENFPSCRMRAECYMYVDVVISEPIEYLEAVSASINIQDIRDYVPRFDPDHVTLTFSEAAQKGTTRSLELALDYDSPEFGVKRYELISSVNTFKLESKKTSGLNQVFSSLQLVLDGPLDREKIARYDMLLVAYDSVTDDQSRRGNLTITVIVDDDNDNKPEFVNSSYVIYISEEAKPIQKLIQVQAFDKDTGANAKVSYQFTPSTQNTYGHIFSINNRTGAVSLMGILDYEQTKLYNLQVTAKDSGLVPQTSTADIIIHVIDQNDNTPQIKINTFGAGLTASINESSPINTFVAQVSVFDSDSGVNGQIVCTLPQPSAFTLQSLTGANQYKVVTAVKLDREKQEIYSLHITCTDQGDSPKQVTETLVVSVTDENDNPPVLDQPRYDINVKENNNIGDIILQLNGTDEDKGENGRLSYKISQGEISKLISIGENTGTVTANVVFDYETMPEINFEITVTDHGNPPKVLTVPVKIHVIDGNDEAPAFKKQIYQFPVPENNQPHIPIGQVSAEDKDKPPNNRFKFSIPPSFSNVPFYVNEDSGVVIASDTFDRETRDAYYFEVQVTDVDNPKLSNTATVIVSVGDKNDHRPEIVYPPANNSTATISNSVPVGTPVISIQVADADSEINANITFSLQNLQSMPNGAPFRISSTGTIETNTDLTSIEYQQFEVMVYIEDKGLPPLSNKQKVTITVDSSITFTTEEPVPSGSNLHIIVSVSVVSIVIVVGLIVAIAVIKTRACGRKIPKNTKYDGPYTIDHSEGKPEDVQVQQPDSQVAEQGFSNLGYTIEGGVPISLHPSGQKSSRSTSPDSLLYDLKLEKVQTQKAYLGQMKGTDHDTSSSGSTDDSGRGPSEEGGDILARQSPFNESVEHVPNLHELYTQKKPSLRSNSSGKSHVIAKPQVKIPPSYDSYMRTKANRSTKRVNFALTEEEENETGSKENVNNEQLPVSSVVIESDVRGQNSPVYPSAHREEGYVFLKHKDPVQTLPSSNINNMYMEQSGNANTSRHNTNSSHMSSTVV